LTKIVFDDAVVYKIAAENRTFKVAFENRTKAVVRENREYKLRS
jgi:hypothetical protein